MPVAPAAVDVLAALVGVLPRDVTLRLTPDSPDRFVEDMRVAGFELRVDDPEFARRTRVPPFVHGATGMPLDIVLAGSGLEDEFLTRARLLDIGGLRVPTIDPEDLIIAKRGQGFDLHQLHQLQPVLSRSISTRNG